jgi:hypothetical protein
MNESWQRARARYESETTPPKELAALTQSAVRTGVRAGRRRRQLWRRALSAAACLALFFGAVNLSPTFAQAMGEVPVLGRLARLFTVAEYTLQDREHLIDVRLPALENTGNTALEQRINLEIAQRIQQVLDEAEARARESRQAWIDTGGDPEEFMPIIIHVDYELKCSSEEYVSFLLYKTETTASAYTEIFTYNLDLETGKELTLRDLLGPNYKEVADQVVREEIDRRSQLPGNVFFTEEEYGGQFEGISPEQKFYLNQAGRPVLLFEKYEIAPGFMGIQAFEIP